jgi:hypothetical protein
MYTPDYPPLTHRPCQRFVVSGEMHGVCVEAALRQSDRQTQTVSPCRILYSVSGK